MNRVYKVVCFIWVVSFLGACTGGGIFGLPGPQDGTWVFSTSEPLASGTNYTVQISTDRITSISINGSLWTVSQANPATRTGAQIVWATVAKSPSGAIGIQLTKEFDLNVTPQTDGSLMGTASEGLSFSGIPGVGTIPTVSFPITMHKI